MRRGGTHGIKGISVTLRVLLAYTLARSLIHSFKILTHSFIHRPASRSLACSFVRLPADSQPWWYCVPRMRVVVGCNNPPVCLTNLSFPRLCCWLEQLSCRSELADQVGKSCQGKRGVRAASCNLVAGDRLF
ncbi:hypothetical protein EV127DRAFT_137411 [Xylaria flabelliformis]|nr:hypothetical protein EV127DRAFT_137411 [Xylaria flabelliformis]